MCGINEGRRAITPEEAETLLRENNFSGQRRVREETVKRYAKAMADGRWTPGTQLAFCECEGQLVLVNGQHRLSAVVAHGAPVEFQILVNKVSHWRQISEQYARHDYDAKKRSFGDVLRAAGMYVESGLPLRVLNNIPLASVILDRGFRDFKAAETESAEARLDRVRAWTPTAKILVDSTKTKIPRIEDRPWAAGSLAVMLATIKYCPERAVAFWRTSLEDDGLRNTDPRYHVVRYIDSNVVHCTADRESLARACANAWNAYYLGREMKCLRPRAKHDIWVAGTPWANPQKKAEKPRS